LTCGVYDYIFKGTCQPLIGNFDINIGELQHHQDDHFLKEDEKTMKIIKDLEQKIAEAEELKKKLEEERKQAERERIQEEKMKKQLNDKANLKLRQMLGLKAVKIKVDKEWLKGKQKGKLLEEEDIEMGKLKKDDDKKEEKKEDEGDDFIQHMNSAIDLIKQKDDLEEGKEKTEREKVEEVMNEKEAKKQMMKTQRLLTVK